VITGLTLFASCGGEPSKPQGATAHSPPARELAIRLDETSCLGEGVATGFAIDHTTLVTARHVVADATSLTATMPQGGRVAATDYEQNLTHDLGLVHVTVPEGVPIVGLARRDPMSGDRIRAVGFPRGRPVTVTSGRVVEYVDGARYHEPGRVVRTSAEVEPGNSGGPLVNTRGEVVGVVFAIDLVNNDSLAIPVSTLRQALERRTSFSTVTPQTCG
jgi:S1-C subfamily serine protease